MAAASVNIISGLLFSSTYTMYSLKERDQEGRRGRKRGGGREGGREREREREREIDSHAFEAVSMLGLTNCLFDIFKLLDVISQLK